MKLTDFHRALQIAMGWGDYHLHQFSIGSRTFSIPDSEWGDNNALDERRFQIGHALKAEKDVLIYEYDFGDGWEHQVHLEKILPFDKSETLPRCISGKRSCPPEDVGGPWGYKDFLKAIGDTGHLEHEEMMEWVGGEFDAELFDLETVNKTLDEEF
jgi:hypothetical protein